MRLAEAIQAVKDGLSFCRQCRNIAEGELCEFCRDPMRDRSKILVIEEPSTLYAIERAGGYRGLYHVLLGVLSPLDGVAPSDIRAEELLERVKAGGVEEVIVAADPVFAQKLREAGVNNSPAQMSQNLGRLSGGLVDGDDAPAEPPPRPAGGLPFGELGPPEPGPWSTWKKAAAIGGGAAAVVGAAYYWIRGRHREHAS